MFDIHKLMCTKTNEETTDDVSVVVLNCGCVSVAGFVTLLATFHYAGLQVCQEDGGWLAVPCRPNALVMNAGDMLAAMTGGKFKATRHRVVDTGVDRFSVPFFFEPRYTADITRVIAPCEEVQSQSTSSTHQGHKLYGPWLIEKMRSFAEFRETIDSFTNGAAVNV